MRKARVALFGVAALSLVAISAPAAQQNGKGKKPPKQTQDKGFDSPEPVAPSVIGDRIADNAIVTVRPDGSAVAYLDESFHDALVARKGPDGKLTYVCLHGLPAGAKHISDVAPVAQRPVLEEK